MYEEVLFWLQCMSGKPNRRESPSSEVNRKLMPAIAEDSTKSLMTAEEAESSRCWGGLLGTGAWHSVDIGADLGIMKELLSGMYPGTSWSLNKVMGHCF